MKRQPLLWAALILAAGIGAAAYLHPWRPALAAAAILGGLALAAWYWWRRELHLPLALVLVFIAGTLLVSPPLPTAEAARITMLRGWLDGETRESSGRSYLGARVTSWRLGNGPWADPRRTLRAWVAGLPTVAGYGVCFEARGRFVPSPGGGYEGYFFAKTAAVTGERAGNPLRRAGLALRSALDGVYARCLNPIQKGLLAGLVLGDLAGISPEEMRWFSDTGAVHLLSVSGLHVGFAAVLAVGLAGLVGWRGWRAWLLTVFALLGYILVCGPKPPILRAAVMTAAIGAGRIQRRSIDAGNLLGLAGLTILTLQPWALGTLSFQLSFAATAGLIFLYPQWAQWCPRRWAWLGKPFLISLAAAGAVLPLQAMVFGRISLIGPLANLILVPLAGVAVQAGLAAGLAGTVAPMLAAPILTGVGAILDAIVLAARILASVPGAAWTTGAWPWPIALVFYALLLASGVGLAKDIFTNRPRWAAGTLILIVAAAGMAFVWWRVLAYPSGLSVTFIDAGQGDSIFIRAPGGRTMLIDGGDGEAGPRVLSFLRRQGVNRLDVLVATHPHADHVGGLAAVAEAIPVNLALDPGWPYPADLERGFPSVLKERGINLRPARRGLAFSLGGGVTGAVLYPFVGTARPMDENDGSLVIKLAYGRHTLLFPGDLGLEGEAELLAAGDDLRSTVLKVAHHGSSSATDAGWLDAVRPGAAVICVGAGNPFFHPHPATLHRLAGSGAEIHRTDLEGDITWISDGRRGRFVSEH